MAEISVEFGCFVLRRVMLPKAFHEVFSLKRIILMGWDRACSLLPADGRILNYLTKEF